MTRFRRLFTTIAITAAILLTNTPVSLSGMKVKVGVHETHPLAVTAKDGSLTGIYPEVLREVAKISEWEIEWVKVKWFDGIRMTQSNEVDLFCPIGFTAERLKQFQFNEAPVFVDWGIVYVAQSSTIETVLDLEGKKVVFQDGHMAGQFLENMLKKFGVKYVRVKAESQDKVFEMISNGTADAGAVNRLFGLMNEKRYPIRKSPIIYAPLELRFAASKNIDTKILAQLDSSLKKLKSDKQSAYYAILDRWLYSEMDPGPWFTRKQVLAAAGIGSVIVIAMLLWMFSLKFQVRSKTREVAERTRQLEESNRLLNAVMTNTTDAIFVKDLKGRYILVNEAACKALGTSMDQIIGKADSDLFPTESARVIQTVDTRVMSKGEPLLAEEKLETAYGQTYWLANKSPYFDENERVIGIIGISRNITELKTAQFEKDKLQSQLRQAHKMEAIGTLAGGIAHDFNNILGIIIGNLELALGEIPHWHSIRDNMEEIRTASFRARDVVRQLLSFSRKTEQAREPVEINEIVNETMSLLRASMPSTIEVIKSIPDAGEVIAADATQVHQVLINLCTNAAHAMEKGGGILRVEVVKARLDRKTVFDFGELSEGNYVKLIVQDTGCGIDPEVQKKMFDPYFTNKEIGKGTGMGLAVVQGIVLNHGGAIAVKSKIREGTSIEVWFPVSDRKKEPKPVAAETLPRGTETVLFIDDEASLAKLGKQILEQLGYRALVFTDPQEALDLFASHPSRFDLVITDMTMPKMTGDQLAKAVLAIRPDMPVILCTGFRVDIDNTKTGGSGIRKLLEKPINKVDLATVIRETLDMGKKDSA